ncbi:MAG TPA: hypothetical protein VLD35_04075 [Caldimonas sp.]|nr:hypothetical protein [Caldimonas sp.]
MKFSDQGSSPALCRRLAVLLATAPLIVLGAAYAAPAPPDPCKLVTVAEMQQMMGPLSGAPTSTDPKSGEISCSYSPAKGPSFVEITLHDGDLAGWKKRNGGKNPVAVPEFGADAFINPDFQDWADLYAKKGGLILRVTMPKGAQSMEAVKAIARKALARL